MTTFITTADLRAYVNNGKAADEAQLQAAVDVACAAVEDGSGDTPGVGPVLEVSRTENVYAYGSALVLSARVSSLTSIATYPGGVAQAVGDFRASGQVLQRVDGGLFGPVTVVYVTGSALVPSWAREAALVIAAHYWQSRLKMPGAPQPGVGIGYLVPAQAEAMLAPHRLAPLGFA